MIECILHFLTIQTATARFKRKSWSDHNCCATASRRCLACSRRAAFDGSPSRPHRRRFLFTGAATNAPLSRPPSSPAPSRLQSMLADSALSSSSSSRSSSKNLCANEKLRQACDHPFLVLGRGSAKDEPAARDAAVSSDGMSDSFLKSLYQKFASAAGVEAAGRGTYCVVVFRRACQPGVSWIAGAVSCMDVGLRCCDGIHSAARSSY
jgi:hypothetical protein